MQSIVEERANPSFPVQELTYLLEGGKRNAEMLQQMMLEFERDPLWKMEDYPNLPLNENRERTMAKTKSMVQYLTNESEKIFRMRVGLVSLIDTAFWTRLGVHYGLFFGALQSQASGAQMGYWAEKGVLSMKGMFGCFAMTEMGHGSNVAAGLETTATFDAQTDEFIIHTPSITATKWWIGGAAHTATHAAVYARLLVDDKDHGVKVFIVPLRDPETYAMKPGITIGDIGKKMGRDGIDNGWIQFTYVRIPRFYMLQKHTKVTREGEVIAPPLNQLAYGALIQGRVAMVADSANQSKKALTVAIRYAGIRRQFAPTPDQPETKLLDYPIHQYRLLPLLAQCYAMAFAGQETARMYTQTMEEMESAREGDDLTALIENLKETHATSAGLKAFCTWNCLATIDQCRQSLGGHGYSSYTALSGMYADFAVQCTWEGDNTILTLQCGRYLVACYRAFKRGKPLPANAAYLADAGVSAKSTAQTDADLLSLSTISKGWGAVSGNAVLTATRDFEAALAEGLDTDAAYEKCSAARLHAARMHCFGYLFNRFAEGVQRAPASLQPVLTKLCALYGLYNISTNNGEFLLAGFFDTTQMSRIKQLVNQLCAEIRKDAVPLVDAFNYSDYVIGSPLGRYDGNIYESYLDLVKRLNPVPTKPVSYFESTIKPLLHRKIGDDSSFDDEE
ncbi:acyl-CoA oxidase [Ramicandelaber brevisporus]|nr:acyl-CoA oxidase [Ramicandelaber brevisporus]